jgi:glycosyltransferase involved in cell wall biosynthesis
MVLSVITPSFRQLDWLRLAIASVQDQVGAGAAGTGSEWRVEHIVQDAGTPGIEEFAAELGAAFYREGKCLAEGRPVESGGGAYRLTIHAERDRGMYDAINRGLARSSGEVCAWLNSDEQYLEGTLARVVARFSADPTLGVLLGDALLTDGEHRPLSYRRIMRPTRWHTRLIHLHSLSCAMFFRRQILPHPPLEPQWKIIGDAVLMDHFLVTGARIVACNQLLSAFSFTGQNLSNDGSEPERRVWWERTRQPPRCWRMPVMLGHRLRRLLHGAYQRREVTVGLYVKAAPGARRTFSARVGSHWPAQSTA